MGRALEISGRSLKLEMTAVGKRTAPQIYIRYRTVLVLRKGHFFLLPVRSRQLSGGEARGPDAIYHILESLSLPFKSRAKFI